MILHFNCIPLAREIFSFKKKNEQCHQRHRDDGGILHARYEMLEIFHNNATEKILTARHTFFSVKYVYVGYYLCDVRPVIIFPKTKIYQIQNFYDIILCLNERIYVPVCINTLKYYHEINPVIRFLQKNRNLKRLIRRENDID